METNINSLTQIQIVAVKAAITESMRISLAKTNLKYDPQFEQITEAIASSIIDNAQIILKTTKVVKNEKLINKKKNARRK